ncbi:UPF0149 family protein [Marinomonas spartinae]|uniref:UPF0149 family protein n=1 Tax=Marinomonas spartinae TaxID=1792290 RepID=UPI0018F11AC7|nr:UPF0149 family protein [Marinomonas spartinae]MBJ7552804.1 UPF0149 family protein [Marinomonas spartinae]
MSENEDQSVISEEELYERLDYYLSAYGCERSLLCVSELDGFLTAIGCSAQELAPDQWLTTIWGTEEDQPEWLTQEEEDEFLSLVLIMYMETMNALVHGEISPVYLEQEFDGKFQLVVEEWCLGFVRGARLAGLGLDESNRDFYNEVLAPVRLFGTSTGWKKLENMVEEEVDFWRDTIEPSILRLAQFNHPEIQGAQQQNAKPHTLH